MRVSTATKETLENLFRLKYGDSVLGWGPRRRLRFGYFTPDDFYEAIVAKLFTDGCYWLDVGCGREIFPDNHRLAKTLSSRASLVVGVDPSQNICENEFIHKAVRAPIEDFQSESKFDLVTLRMVAEHVTNPSQIVETLTRVTKPGAKVVLYTVNRYSPTAFLSALIPFRAHHILKAILWKTEERDTFPVVYKMNTRKTLLSLMNQSFRERDFMYLDDCRLFARFRMMNLCELLLQKMLSWIHLNYPETCLLGVYERD